MASSLRAAYNPFQREPEIVVVDSEPKDYSGTVKTVAGIGAIGLILWFLFRKGKNSGAQKGNPTFKLGGEGLSYQGKPIDAIKALEMGIEAGKASLLVTGDARQGDLEAMMALFKGRGIPLVIASPGAHAQGLHAGATSLPFPDHIERAREAAQMSRYGAQALTSRIGVSLYRKGAN